MSLVYELLDKKDKIRSVDQETRLPLPDRSLTVATKKRSRSLTALIIASLAFIVSLAAFAGGWYLYDSMRSLQMDYMSLDATMVQVSQRVQTLDDETAKLRTDFNALNNTVKSHGGENEKLKLEVEHAKAEMGGIKQTLTWVLNVNKDLQEQVRMINSQSLKASSAIHPIEEGSRQS